MERVYAYFYRNGQPRLEEWRVASKRLEDAIGKLSNVPLNHKNDFKFPDDITNLTDEFLEGWIHKLRKKRRRDSQGPKSS